MKERPILFSGEMVRAILDGRKTQTRRIISKRVKFPDYPMKSMPSDFATVEMINANWPCPYGKVGHRLWVRESFCYTGYDDGDGFDCLYMADVEGLCKENIRWTPSIHMKREHSRITLEITNIRVERLNDISEEDAKAEGLLQRSVQSGKHFHPETMYVAFPEKDGGFYNPIEAFELLWESINGAGSWYKNDWVWVIEFKRINQ